MNRSTFRELEHAGWSARADAYDDHFAKVTRQAIDATLAELGDLADRHLLDVACGTGHLAGAAAARGAAAEGLDFSAAMVAKAADNYPDCTFTEGDAGNLPYEDRQFDAVACSFGLLHLEDADAAIREAYRVLRAGGRFAFSVWRGPDQGGEIFALVLGSVQKHGNLDVGLPPAPPMFRFAEADECERALRSAGFSRTKTNVVRLEWRGPSPESLLEMVYKSVVRMPMVLDAQKASARRRIEKAILEGAEAHRQGNEIVIAFPAMLAVATRPN